MQLPHETAVVTKHYAAQIFKKEVAPRPEFLEIGRPEYVRDRLTSRSPNCVTGIAVARLANLDRRGDKAAIQRPQLKTRFVQP